MMGITIALAMCCSVDSSLLQLEDGDTIAIIGNTFAERMQHYPYFEAGLRAAYPETELHVRNLAWSGDEVALQPRPLNFAGMAAHLDRVDADTIIACFGMNESYQGDGGLLQFRRDLGAWLDANQGRRVVLVSPVAHESLGGRMPDGSIHTFDLGRYTQVMREEAARREVVFVDLHYPSQRWMAGGDDLTINGIHLNDAGYRLAAAELLVRLGIDSEGTDAPPDRLDAIREKNRFVFERFRPINTEYVYGRRHNPFGDDNFPAEMTRLEDLAAAADASLLLGEPFDASTLALQLKPLPSPSIPEPAWDAVATPPEERPVPSVSEQLGNFELPNGWSINCFASEERFPELANPIAMNFDGDGRLWVVVAPTYPHVLPGEAPQDKLIVLEDTNRDGRADTLTVFADDLYIPTGFATNGDEAWVVSQPNLLHVADTDGDGVSDTRQIVLHGFGPEDGHHAMSAFARPPDGSIYFQEGTFHHTQIESPHGPARSTDAAVYRYDPDTAEAEVASSWPWANPWGHVFDEWGRSIITDGTSATSRRLTHIAGAHPYPDVGKGGSDVRGVPSFTPGNRRPGGGTEILGGDHLPPSVRGRMVIPQNIGYHGLHWYDLREVDSGFAADAVNPDLVYSTDPTCRPVDVESGPDGGIYMLDWANPIVGHMQFSVRDPRRDHSHGRVWRITQDARPPSTWEPVRSLENPDLFSNLTSTSPWKMRRSRIELQERPADEVLPEAVAWAAKSGSARDALEALWLHQAHGVINVPLLDQVLMSGDPRARAAAVAVLRDWQDEVDAIARLRAAVLDTDPGVRLEAMLALSYLDDPRALELMALAMHQPMDAGMKAVRSRAIEAMRQYGTPGGPGTESWRLSRLSNASLAAEPLGHFSAVERLARALMPEQERLAAAEWLAAQSGQSLAAELWDAVQAAPNGGAVTLLLDQSPQSLAAIEEQLIASTQHGSAPQLLREAAWAARARLAGWSDAWKSATAERGTSQRIDLLAAAAEWPRIAGGDGRRMIRSILESGPLPSEPIHGRFVRVELNGPATLTLAEVEVISGGKNVALGRPCSQSSTNWEGLAGRAVDGDSNGAWSAGVSTHTIENEPDPWWEVDLGSTMPIDRITLHNRTDRPHHERLDGFHLIVLDESRNAAWIAKNQPAPEYRADVVPGGDADMHVRIAAMPSLASADPSESSIRILATWAERGSTEAMMAAALAMDQIDVAWPSELEHLRLKRVVISTVPHKMVYDVKRFDVIAGQPTELVIVNEDAMPHNLIIGRPGSLRQIGRAADAQGTSGEAESRGYVPDVDGIMHTSPLVLEGATERLRFIAPMRPGRYPYVCTYPGHWQMMNGVMNVKRSAARSDR